jgi:type I restriction enzyme, R subunit
VDFKMHAGLGLQHADHAQDLMDAPEFSGREGVVRARALFGARLPAQLDELTDTLVA